MTGIIHCLKRKHTTLEALYWLLDTQVKQKLHEADVEADSDTGSLPDQLVSPGEYEPAQLPTREEHTAPGKSGNKQQ